MADFCCRRRRDRLKPTRRQRGVLGLIGPPGPLSCLAYRPGSPVRATGAKAPRADRPFDAGHQHRHPHRPGSQASGWPACPRREPNEGNRLSIVDRLKPALACGPKREVGRAASHLDCWRPRRPGVASWLSPVRLSGIGSHLPLLGLMSAAGIAGTVTVATLLAVDVGALGRLARWPASAVGPPDDRPRPGGGLAGMAFAVQLDHHVGAQGGVVLLATDPLEQLGRSPFSSREGARVDGHKHRVQARCGRLPAALLGGAAAFMLPSCSASWKARSASARSARNRLGCQPSRWRSCPRSTRLRTRQWAGAGSWHPLGTPSMLRRLAEPAAQAAIEAEEEACWQAHEATTAPTEERVA